MGLIVSGGFSQWCMCPDKIALDPASSNLVQDDIQTEGNPQVIENLQAILQEAGMGLANVVKCTIFVKDLNCGY